jgi:hypothetical protein
MSPEVGDSRRVDVRYEKWDVRKPCALSRAPCEAVLHIHGFSTQIKVFTPLSLTIRVFIKFGNGESQMKADRKGKRRLYSILFKPFRVEQLLVAVIEAFTPNT